MNITPDHIVFWQSHGIVLNATLVWTWAVMLLLAAGSWVVTRNLRSDAAASHGQHLLEAIVSLISAQIRDISGRAPDRFLPFTGTLFLFIFASNVLTIVPGAPAPTGSLSTTAALAICVFIAVPVFGIREQGLRGYLRHYAEPSVLMVPLTIIGDVSRTVALALRLFGNMMSSAVMAAIFISLTPLFFPAVLEVFGLVIGAIQAYIFSVLATVYVASATRAHDGSRSARPGKREDT